MQTLYNVAINNVGQVAVAVWSDRRQTPYQWKQFFCVSQASIARLRSLYLKYPKRFYIQKEWSPAKWKAYKDWRKLWVQGETPCLTAPSLVNLETNTQG